VTRNLKEGADIIFCPYNYLIDPLVRKSVSLLHSTLKYKGLRGGGGKGLGGGAK
jgi:hypothetical protein